jgi:hypothetical protein
MLQKKTQLIFKNLHNVLFKQLQFSVQHALKGLKIK